MRTSPISTAVEPGAASLEASARELVRVAADLAGFCEHVEHNEPNTLTAATTAADRLRRLAADLASASGLSLCELYRDRLLMVEQASMHSRSSIPGLANLSGVEAMRDVTTWDQVQIAQLLHDRQFHPDVFGMSKLDQLRHYTFHVTKLAGLMFDAIDNGSWSHFRSQRLADLAIFGVKLATVCNVTLGPSLVDA